MKMQVGYHSQDWCHLCGRTQDSLADIWYPDNAEHRDYVSKYIRICLPCAALIQRVS